MRTLGGGGGAPLDAAPRPWGDEGLLRCRRASNACRSKCWARSALSARSKGFEKAE